MGLSIEKFLFKYGRSVVLDGLRSFYLVPLAFEVWGMLSLLGMLISGGSSYINVWKIV
jgi:hypothetical protein